MRQPNQESKAYARAELFPCMVDGYKLQKQGEQNLFIYVNVLFHVA